MKLRKNEMISPKSFFAPMWEIKNSHVESWAFYVAIVCDSDAVRKFTCSDTSDRYAVTMGAVR